VASKLVRWIPHKRAFLARTLGLSGVLGLLEWVIRRRRPMLAVLTYHRIAVPGVRSDPYYDPVISATPEGFDHQLRFLKRHFRPIGLEELRDTNGLQAMLSRTKRPLVLVTFDDGYRDNFEVALPILHRHEVPATFFIPSSFLSRPRLPWWDQVAYLLKHTDAERLTLKRYEGDPAPLPLVLGRAPDDRARIIASARRAIEKMGGNDGADA